jgi:hypothetical protein
MPIVLGRERGSNKALQRRPRSAVLTLLLLPLAAPLNGSVRHRTRKYFISGSSVTEKNDLERNYSRVGKLTRDRDNLSRRIEGRWQAESPVLVYDSENIELKQDKPEWEYFLEVDLACR